MVSRPQDDDLNLRLLNRPSALLSGFTLRRPTGCVLGNLYPPGADIPPRGAAAPALFCVATF